MDKSTTQVYNVALESGLFVNRIKFLTQYCEAATVRPGFTELKVFANNVNMACILIRP